MLFFPSLSPSFSLYLLHFLIFSFLGLENTKTALYAACKHGKTDIVEKLLNLGADWKVLRKGISPLLIAAKYGHLAIVQKLLNVGAPLDTCDDSLRTALHYAAWGGCTRESAAVAQWLVEEKGAKVDAIDAVGLTPMCYAAESDNLEVLKFLEEKGGVLVGEYAEDDEYEREPSLLSLAVQGEALRVIQYLCERGVKMEDADLLHNAARHHPATLEALVKGGLVDKRTANTRDEDGNTPLHLIFSETEFSETMLAAGRALVRAGANINAKDELGKTAISKWVSGAMYNEGILERGIQELQKIGADMNEGGSLHMCVSTKEMDLFEKLLRKYGAGINARYEGETSLHMAARENMLEWIEMLVREGAEINAQDKEGHTPAHLAKKRGLVTMYNRLVKLGAQKV